MKRYLTLCLLLTLAMLPLFCEDITFSGGYTRMKMQEENKVITLGNKATVTVGSLTLKADNIELSGKDFSIIDCTGSVSVTDSEKGFSLVSKNLHYDRIENKLIVDSWVELQDATNALAASAGWLEFDMGKGSILLQIHARLFHDTSEGPMVCKSDMVRLDREGQTLVLTGNATIDWKNDAYEAQVIQVNLETKEIKMDGSIKGTVHG
ncbi:LptA/OstA family protein [uncultured Sphaerochaeta sp.]|uniref:LptA/OstA family protein n=1 Tax=uncultured Sphaerochaeta sp. TaxID=886478 RepID=UPI002A0A66FE|nr:LptA/OstA family protein [uncultured Sphaerochaeta sp.]